jgi:hypothetical protein
MRGGKRTGAGRKAGSLTQKTREIAERAIAGELPLAADYATVTPLEVMLSTMRELYAARELLRASDIAARCAPYVHAKLASIEHTGTDGGPLVPSKIEIVFVGGEQDS